MEQIILKDLNENHLVTQSNSLVEARYTLTKNEQLIICTMISFINPNDKEFMTYKMSISGFAKLLGINKKSMYKDIDNITTRLINRSIKIEIGDDEWEKYNWVSKIKCSKENDEILLKFNNELRPYLLALSKKFTSYKLKEIVVFKSAYTIKMYQLLKSNHSKNKMVFTQSLESFRHIMLGDETNKYPEFKRFRSRVLDVSQKELNEKSNLSFNFNTIKVGRKIGRIEFEIIELDKKPETGGDIVIDKIPQIIELLEEEGVKREFSLPYLERDGENALERALLIFNADKKSGKIRDDEQGYLVSLLKAGAGVLTEAERRAEENKNKQESDKKDKERLIKLEELKLSLSKSFLRQKKEVFLSNLSDKDAQRIVEDVRTQHKGSSIILGMIKDIDSGIVQEEISRLIKAQEGYAEEEATYINSCLAE